MLILEDDATLRNIIIRPGQATGVHGKGTCTLESVCLTTVALSRYPTFMSYVEDYGKLVRSCGNCKDNGCVLYGINTNYGDTFTISNACQDPGKNCNLFEVYTHEFFHVLTLSFSYVHALKSITDDTEFSPGILHHGRILRVETAKGLCLDVGQSFLKLQPSKDLDYTPNDFTGLTAFPSSHPVLNNYMKDVKIKEAQEAIDPVMESALKDAFKSVTKLKSRKQVRQKQMQSHLRGAMLQRGHKFTCPYGETMVQVRKQNCRDSNEGTILDINDLEIPPYSLNIANTGQGITNILTATQLPIKATESSSCLPFSINTEVLSDDLKLISYHPLLQLEHAGTDMCRRCVAHGLVHEYRLDQMSDNEMFSIPPMPFKAHDIGQIDGFICEHFRFLMPYPIIPLPASIGHLHELKDRLTISQAQKAYDMDMIVDDVLFRSSISPNFRLAHPVLALKDRNISGSGDVNLEAQNRLTS
ncbi:pectate lyase [Fusarium mundagurra]|uniref:pectate lyase n=1 Tax=Fusarium mundagurra TaxID=1567541 RepID=A0A8H6D4F3_9HYPO|nr:pectate lyase [Fusarium mundagurra]